MMIIPIVIGAFGRVFKTFGTGTGGLGNSGTNGDHPNYYIFEIDQNTEKSPGDLRRRCHSNSNERPLADGKKTHEEQTPPRKLWNMRVTVIPDVTGALGTVPKGLVSGNWRMSRDYPNYSIVENCRNTEKNRGDLRRLAISQIQVKCHQLTLVWKTSWE